MRKQLLSFVSIILLVSVLVSCGDSPKAPVEPEKQVVTQSLSEMAQGDTIKLENIGSDTILVISDFDLSDGVYISSTTSKGITDASEQDNEELFKRADGNFMPVPNTKGEASFQGSDINVRSSGTILIKRYEIQTDMSISADEYPDYSGLVEEYYYVDFHKDAFKDLDKSEIVVVRRGKPGVNPYFILQTGFLKKDSAALFDFSNFDGFGIDLQLMIDQKVKNENYLVVMNPIHMEDSAVDLKSDINVLYFKHKDSNKYKLTVTFSGANVEDVLGKIATADELQYMYPRYTDGKNRLTVVPEFDLANSTIIYHLGEIDKDFLLTLDYNSSLTGFVEGSATAKLEVDDNPVVFNDVTKMLSENKISIKAVGTSGIITYAFTAEDETSFFINKKAGINISGKAITTGDLEGTGSSGVPSFDYPTQIFMDCHGFITIKYSGATAGQDVAELEMAVHQAFDPQCKVLHWDSTKWTYVCDDCGKEYATAFMYYNAPMVIEGMYWTDDEYGKYGKIGFGTTEDYFFKVRTSNNIYMNRHTQGNANGREEVGCVYWDDSEINNQVEVRVKRIDYSGEKKVIYCDIYLSGSETPSATDVKMTNVHTHDWEFVEEKTSGDQHIGYMKCKDETCTDTRYAIQMLIGPGGPYHLIANGVYELSVPDMTYYEYCNSEFSPGELPISALVYFIAPNASNTLTVEQLSETDWKVTLNE